MPNRIMVVEDDPQVRRLMAFLLDNEGFKVTACADGREALDAIDHADPDLVLLDLMMPNIDGVQFAKTLRSRQRYQKLPILVVTARDQQIDKYEAFKVGANAFLTKPFDPVELMLNVRSLLSLSSKADRPTTVCIGVIELDTERLLVRVEGREYALTRMETSILQQLMLRPGKVLSAVELSELVHDTHRSVDAVHAHVRNLRTKIEANPKEPRYLITLGRRGYYFASDMP
jgi:DNA-binding response OmpR family regulator